MTDGSASNPVQYLIPITPWFTSMPRPSMVTQSWVAASRNKRPDPEYRATRIAAEVSKFDVVALQEVFDGRWRDLIIEAVRAREAEHIVARRRELGHEFMTQSAARTGDDPGLRLRHAAWR